MSDESDYGNREQFDRKCDELGDYFDSIGLHRLAREVRNERFNFRILDANLLANRWEFEADFLERREEKIQEILLNYQIQIVDKAQSYNNVVVSLGYAGFFAIWNFTNSSLADFDRLLVAFLLGTSLIIFVFWTIYIALKTTKISVNALKEFTKNYNSRDEMLEAIQELKLKEAKSTARTMMYYPIAFFSSAISGFSAGIILLILLGTRIMGIPFTFSAPLDYIVTKLHSLFWPA